MTLAAQARLTSVDRVRAIEWREGVLRLLDQRLLPHETRYLEFGQCAEVADAIGRMVVRGAPAIGIAAAYGVVLAAGQCYAASKATWRRGIAPDLERLAGARPTAVNLAWALARMRQAMDAVEGDPVPVLEAEARRIHEEDIAANRRLGEWGADCFTQRAGVLTHCNTGSLATGGYGTALGVIRSAHGRGLLRATFITETRPWLQGTRLTAWELAQDGIPGTVIADGAAAALMASGRVQWLITGADRIAANGDVVNKIGTYALAVLARQHGVRFMVAAPTSTLDMAAPDATRIPIEQRAAEELLTLGTQRLAPAGADAWNPVFDVTPAALVDVLVTERGVVRNPDKEGIRRLLQSQLDTGIGEKK